MSDSSKSFAELEVAVSDVAALLADSYVLQALTSHLTAREVMIIARLFQAAGNDTAYRWVMEGIIHGDEEVRAVASPVATGPGSVRIEYFDEFSECGIESAPLHVREFETGGLSNAMRELGLELDREMADWAARHIPGRIVLDSVRRA
ncbi:hypothetical protein [Dietzia sp. DQ12-45-1b]|uniref:hypothetical protein n=1 Tax=Dietzia sp. DQ12-45-1b TaxID=912801 RepID=UPI0012E93A9D|nr:hypothetical protein [Dietzia sp. DQ12-45-1b]